MTIADRKPIKGTDTASWTMHDLPPAALWEENGYSIAHRQLVLSVPKPTPVRLAEARKRRRSPSGGISACRAQEMVSDSQHYTPEAV